MILSESLFYTNYIALGSNVKMTFFQNPSPLTAVFLFLILTATLFGGKKTNLPFILPYKCWLYSVCNSLFFPPFFFLFHLSFFHFNAIWRRLLNKILKSFFRIWNFNQTFNALAFWIFEENDNLISSNWRSQLRFKFWFFFTSFNKETSPGIINLC